MTANLHWLGSSPPRRGLRTGNGEKVFYRNASRGSQGVSGRATAAQPLFQTRAIGLTRACLQAIRPAENSLPRDTPVFYPSWAARLYELNFFYFKTSKNSKILLTGEGQSVYKKNRPTGR
jgi:hypothetical protein